MTWAMGMAVAIALEAGQIVRKTLQQQARQSDIIATAEVRQVRATGIRDTKFGFDRWEADCALREVICGQETNRVLKVTFSIKPSSPITSLPRAESLEPGRAYVLFLRHDRDGLSLVAPWDSWLKVSSSYEVWDEDFRNDPELLKSSPSSIDGVPIVTLTHEALVQKLRASWEKRQTKSEPDGTANGSQPIRSETNTTSSTAGSRR
jgi:hypothetical protein